jgi:hypothetical protein
MSSRLFYNKRAKHGIGAPARIAAEAEREARRAAGREPEVAVFFHERRDDRRGARNWHRFTDYAKGAVAGVAVLSVAIGAYAVGHRTGQTSALRSSLRTDPQVEPVSYPPQESCAPAPVVAPAAPQPVVTAAPTPPPVPVYRPPITTFANRPAAPLVTNVYVNTASPTISVNPVITVTVNTNTAVSSTTSPRTIIVVPPPPRVATPPPPIVVTPPPVIVTPPPPIVVTPPPVIVTPPPPVVITTPPPRVVISPNPVIHPTKNDGWSWTQDWNQQPKTQGKGGGWNQE